MKTDEGTTAVSEQSADETVARHSADRETATANGETEWEDTQEDEDKRVQQREEERRRREKRARELSALAWAVLFLAVGLGAIYVAVSTAGEKDGTVLAALLIIPVLIYLVLSGQVEDLKGPAGLELTLANIANEPIPSGREADDAEKLSFEKIAAIAKGRSATLYERMKNTPPNAPVVLTFTLGSEINGPEASSYVRTLTQLRRFRYVAFLDSRGSLVSYMEERAFRHTLEADSPSALTLINNIRENRSGEVKACPGMIVEHVSPRTSIAQALRKMERTHLNALLVVDKGTIVGIAERDHLANKLLLSLIDRASTKPRAGRSARRGG